MNKGALDVFDPALVERARRYHRPRYVALAADTFLGLGVLVLMSFAWPGDAVYRSLEWLPWWARAVAFPAVVVAASALVRLPLSFWSGHLYERRWGFSTQTIRGWLADRAKVLAVTIGLSGVFASGVVALARALPGAWPVVAAALAAVLVLVLGFLAPVVLEPLFNRFRPLDDERLAADVRRLAERAGTPVREVLVADASRRTRKQNAYVSGVGPTRRIVVWDTLLAGGEACGLRWIVAHELAHRRRRHVACATALAMAGAALFVPILWALVRWESVRGWTGADGAGDPRIAPFILLLSSVLELVALPFAAALSRRWERSADRFALELTGDPAALESVHRDLAAANLPDLDPPRLAYVLLFTHPTPPQRIADGRRWAEELALASD